MATHMSIEYHIERYNEYYDDFETMLTIRTKTRAKIQREVDRLREESRKLMKMRTLTDMLNRAKTSPIELREFIKDLFKLESSESLSDEELVSVYSSRKDKRLIVWY
jgi:sulfatase maturation enzyme AslB (radical SAM superfamily)